MGVLRSAVCTAFAVVSLALIPIEVTHGQAATNLEPQTPPELAKAFAHIINTSTPKNFATTTFVGATSHDNVVDMRFIAKDFAYFLRAKADTGKWRTGVASMLCGGGRIALFKKGILVNDIIVAPDNSEQVSVTVDQAACESVPPLPKQADSKALSEMAQMISNREQAAGKKSSIPSFKFGGASVHDATVEEREIVSDQVMATRLQTKRKLIESYTTGLICGRDGAAIKQGVAFHIVYVLEDGSPVIDFTIDKSKC